MSDPGPPPGYRAYLLRCWQEQSVHEGNMLMWRFSLEDPHTGGRQGFATWEGLVSFLYGELWEKPGVQEPPTEA
ncbi:MAG: hypothetical protein M3220_05910 [Chloroflexota bacterium]|nr:hypothetical protein [Chloroflexota bacterium]